MSSRAVRKLQGSNDLVVPGLEVLDHSDSEASEGETSSQQLPGPSVYRKKKNKVPVQVNPFDLLNEEENVSPTEEPAEHTKDDVEQVEQKETDVSPSVRTKRKKKKKKKNKTKKSEDTNPDVLEEDEIDAGLREVNALLGELPSRDVDTGDAPSGVTQDMRALLSIEHKNLNPDNEMRRIFGSRVVQADQNRGNRRRGRTALRTTLLIRPRDNWPNIGKSGLTMSIVETASGPQMFSFDHNHQYQQAQFEFWDSVESLNPQNIVSVVNAHPYHIDSLLQLSEVCRMSDDTPMATELIERALYVCECSFHPLFNIASGNCRLDYRRQENRAFFVAMFRHIMYVGQRGCYRTALEFCKILLSLDTDNDPLCVLLMIDFYATKAEEFNFLIRLFLEWEPYRNLSQLPNFAFGMPLAIFRLELAKEENEQDFKSADEKLQESLLMFPGFLMPLLDKCSVNPDPEVATNAYFGPAAQMDQPEALKQLIALYVGRCFPCWKEPEVMSWLERNVKEVIKRIERNDPRVADYTQKRMQRYRGTPRNIYRHIILSEIKDATAALPPEHASSAVLSYDPLPPVDAIVSYSRPPRQRAVDQDTGVLSMFFRSLLPNFNPDEIVEDQGAAGGAGGQDLRQGVGALMDAMRDLLSNIQPAAPPREDDQLENEEDQENPPEEFD